MLAATIEAIVVERLEPDWLQHLCLDKGYDNETGWGAIADYDGYEPHIRPIRDRRPPRKKRYSAAGEGGETGFMGAPLS